MLSTHRQHLNAILLAARLRCTRTPQRSKKMSKSQPHLRRTANVLGTAFPHGRICGRYVYRHDPINRLTYVCEQVDFRFKHLFSIMGAFLSAGSLQGCRCRARRVEAHGYGSSSAAPGLLSCYVDRVPHVGCYNNTRIRMYTRRYA